MARQARVRFRRSMPDRGLAELLRGLRVSSVLLLIDRLSLRNSFVDGNADDDPTTVRVVRAAKILGLVSGVPPRWQGTYTTIGCDPQRWAQAIDLINHQRSYLTLIAALMPGRQPTPQEQFSSSPQEYRAFLLGVAASHESHASWLAGLPGLSELRTLVDLGGGLGTFASAWASSDPLRSAVLVDLPFIQDILDELSPKVTFEGVDLEHFDTLPRGDIYLLANVLHLLPQWRDVVRAVAHTMPQDSVLAIMEADADTPSGRLFDLQVHLRSGLRGGLMTRGDIAAAMSGVGLEQIAVMDTKDDSDPFDRSYALLLGRRTGTSDQW